MRGVFMSALTTELKIPVVSVEQLLELLLMLPALVVVCKNVC